MKNRSIYFIFGEDSFLVEEHVRGLINKFGLLEKEQFRGRFDINDLFAAASTGSLFSQGKLILIRSPWFINEAVSDADVKRLQSIFNDTCDSSNIIIVYQKEKKFDQRKKLASYLKKNAETVEFKAFKDWEQDKVMYWIKQRITSSGKKIDQDALVAMAQAEGTNLMQISTEIEKLLVFIGDKNSIILEDVQAVSVSINTSIYELNEAMKISDFKNIMKNILHLLNNNEPPVKILALITANIRLYYQILLLTAQNKNSYAIAKILKKNSYFIEKTAQVIKNNFSVSKLEYAFQKLQQTDINIKSGRINHRKGLELAVIDIFK
ncbi:MAG: DNA polymerase III subunit delta [bacterium]|nr:DNA polymerase III subunit delta [bacterium]